MVADQWDLVERRDVNVTTVLAVLAVLTEEGQGKLAAALPITRSHFLSQAYSTTGRYSCVRKKSARRDDWRRGL